MNRAFSHEIQSLPACMPWLLLPLTFKVRSAHNSGKIDVMHYRTDAMYRSVDACPCQELSISPFEPLERRLAHNLAPAKSHRRAHASERG